MKRTKKFALISAVAALFTASTLTACSSGSDSDCNVGIAMPTRSLERWINDGEGLQKLLQGDGCQVQLKYADNKTEQQIKDLEDMIANGAKILVVASIDGEVLGPVLERAGKADIKVIAYDRLINGTEHVDYYATFDNYAVGKLQGEFIRDTLDLDNAAGPFNFEPFAGSPDDNNAKFFFSGAWDVLKPYLDSGKLVNPSGKAPANNDGWQSIGILGWGSDDAQAEMDNRLATHYTDKQVDVVLSPNDSLAIGILQSLRGAGYSATDMPIVTGQDADKANVEAILKGEQAMTVWKDTRELGKRVHAMVKAILAGNEVEVNDTSTYNNGVKNVPSYLIAPEVVVKDTVQEKLIDSGFLKPADVGL